MRQFVAVLLVAVFVFQSVLAMPVQAAMVSTVDAIQGDVSLATDRDRLNSLVQREDVRAELRRQGVDPDEAAARVASLSDAEVAEINGRLDSLPAGQSVVGIVIGAAVLIFVVLLITDILCVTHVFNFTRCATK